MPLAAIPVAGWIAGGAAAVGAGASIYSANKAAKTSQQATDQTLALNDKQATQAREDAMPFINAGYGAVNAINTRLGLGGQPAATAPSRDERIAADVAGGYYQPGSTVDGYGEIGPGSVAQANAVLSGAQTGTPATAVTTAAPTVNAITGAPAAGGASAAQPGTYGSVADPTYAAPAYKDPGAYEAPGGFQFTEGDYRQSDAYKFQLERGTEAIRAKQAYLGALDSGDTGKELATFSQGLASQDFAKERDFAQGVYTDARDFGRATYDADRAFGRGTYESDRGFDRGVYEGDRGYLTDRYDTQTGNLFLVAGMGQASAAGQAANSANSTAAATNAITSNASNKINAGLATTSNLNNLIGQGINAAAYYYKAK